MVAEEEEEAAKVVVAKVVGLEEEEDAVLALDPLGIRRRRSHRHKLQMHPEVCQRPESFGNQAPHKG